MVFRKSRGVVEGRRRREGRENERIVIGRLCRLFHIR
jgi:hypothetical protein